MTWIDGFVIPVPEARRADYAAMAEKVGRIFLAHGATQVVESWGADVPHGEITDFYRAVAAEPGEGIVFSLIVWPSREVAAAGHKTAFADPRMADAGDMTMFNSRRMIMGGFEQLLSMGERT
ncbi:DUF1428 domain-containing protein [Novosphingobium sp.]|uniref:DUF1428 domain-containing protein n=1 Tax=Novosphingobium sp. TaxID=1874826 RepID=UPI003BAAC9F1